MLDSKMLIAIGSLFALVFSYRSFHGALQRIAAYSVFTLAVVMLLAMNNPISKRYKDIHVHSYTSVLDMTDFTNFHFDGLNFRLVMWKLGVRSVSEGKAVLTGLGGEHYHTAVNNQIRAYHMYTGDGRPNDHGYIDYNLHNQYVESYTQFGLPGLLIVLGILIWLIYNAYRNRNPLAVLAVLLFTLIFLTESVLERQSGVLLFTIIISGEWIQQLHKRSYKWTA
jgi:O-antigen ligase